MSSFVWTEICVSVSPLEENVKNVYQWVARLCCSPRLNLIQINHQLSPTQSPIFNLRILVSTFPSLEKIFLSLNIFETNEAGKGQVNSIGGLSCRLSIIIIVLKLMNLIYLKWSIDWHIVYFTREAIWNNSVPKLVNDDHSNRHKTLHWITVSH